jgi:hypothetical protein
MGQRRFSYKEGRIQSRLIPGKTSTTKYTMRETHDKYLCVQLQETQG